MTQEEREEFYIRLVEQYGKICWYCGLDLTNGETATHLDHIVPKSKGGTDSIENLALACEFCNRAKWGLPLRSFLSWLNWVREKQWTASEIEELVFALTKEYEDDIFFPTKGRPDCRSLAAATYVRRHSPAPSCGFLE